MFSIYRRETFVWQQGPVFTIQNTPLQTEVYLNGVLQTPADKTLNDYTIDNKEIRLTREGLRGDRITVIYRTYFWNYLFGR